DRLKAILGRELLYHSTHIPVTDDRQFHFSKAAGSGLVKNSRWSDSTAPFRSAAATTTLIFSSDAPCEIMRTLMSFRPPKAREATPGVWRMLSPTMQTMA